METRDWIHHRCVERARELGLTAYGISKAARRQVTEECVRDYLTGRKSMTSRRLQHVLTALRLELTAAIES